MQVMLGWELYCLKTKKEDKDLLHLQAKVPNQQKNKNKMSNYSIRKLEFLALKWEYLLGNKFFVFTDSNPLSYPQTANLSAVEQCWASELAVFNFELKYRPGPANKNADALSCQVQLLSIYFYCSWPNGP